MDKTYTSWRDWVRPSLQTEYTGPAPLLAEDGTLLAKGWARGNVFRYDRSRVKHVLRRKEWDFYQISDGRVTLDDGKVLEIRDMYAFCEYVENRW